MFYREIFPRGMKRPLVPHATNNSSHNEGLRKKTCASAQSVDEPSAPSAALIREPPPTLTDSNFPNIDRQMMRGRCLLVVTLTLGTCLERNKRAPKKIAAVAAVWRKQLRFSQQYAGAGEIGTRLAEKGTDFCLSKTSL